MNLFMCDVINFSRTFYEIHSDLSVSVWSGETFKQTQDKRVTQSKRKNS